MNLFTEKFTLKSCYLVFACKILVIAMVQQRNGFLSGELTALPTYFLPPPFFHSFLRSTYFTQSPPSSPHFRTAALRIEKCMLQQTHTNGINGGR